MTELEIIDYLKENRNKGVVFAFMPSKVKNWCRKHCEEQVFFIYGEICGWNKNPLKIVCANNSAYTIINDYKPKPKFEPYYQEFEIDEDGYFYFDGRRYYYREDVRFEVENAEKFKGFGGWLYRGGGFWSTNAMIHSGCNLVDRVGETIRDITPAIPTKIRFWRKKE